MVALVFSLQFFVIEIYICMFFIKERKIKQADYYVQIFCVFFDYFSLQWQTLKIIDNCVFFRSRNFYSLLKRKSEASQKISKSILFRK